MAIWSPIHGMIRRSIPVHIVKTRRRFGSKTASFHVSVYSSVFLYLLLSVCVYMLLLTLLLCSSTFLFAHTHSLGRFWWPWICMFKYWIFYALVQAFVELVFARSWSFSLLILAFLSFFYSYFCTFLDSCISDSVFILAFFYMISCVDAYIWYCSNYWFIMV